MATRDERLLLLYFFAIIGFFAFLRVLLRRDGHFSRKPWQAEAIFD